MEIELATIGDALEILELQRIAYQSEAELYGEWSLPPLVQTLSELIAEFDRCILLLIKYESVLVGSVRAYLEKGTCFIGRLIVHPNFQRQGFGRSLMEAIESRFPQADRFELFTGHRSERNLVLYKRLGYREFRQQAVSDNLTLVFLDKLNTPRAT